MCCRRPGSRWSGTPTGSPTARAVLQWLLVAARREAWRVVRGHSRQAPYEIEDDAITSSEDELPENLVLRER